MTDNESEHKNNDRRSNTGGYSWWKWRRSTDSQEKKLPIKDDIDDKKTTEGAEIEIKQVYEQLKPMQGVDLYDQGPMEPEFSSSTDYELRNINADAIDVSPMDDGDKHDDSITAELDAVSKRINTSEKYRKTLRLTSEQIVLIIVDIFYLYN